MCVCVYPIIVCIHTHTGVAVLAGSGSRGDVTVDGRVVMRLNLPCEACDFTIKVLTHTLMDCDICKWNRLIGYHMHVPACSGSVVGPNKGALGSLIIDTEPVVCSSEVHTLRF